MVSDLDSPSKHDWAQHCVRHIFLKKIEVEDQIKYKTIHTTQLLNPLVRNKFRQ